MTDSLSKILIVILLFSSASGCVGETYDVVYEDTFETPDTLRMQNCDHYKTGQHYPLNQSPQSAPKNWSEMPIIASSVEIDIFDCEIIGINSREGRNQTLFLVSTINKQPPNECLASHKTIPSAAAIHGLWSTNHEISTELNGLYKIPGGTINLVKSGPQGHATWTWTDGLQESHISFITPSSEGNLYEDTLYFYWDYGDRVARMEMNIHAQQAIENQIPAYGRVNSHTPTTGHELGYWFELSGRLTGSFNIPLTIFEDYECGI